MKTLRKDAILWIENTLFLKYGNMGWWPAESTDEVAIGAILTQNTSWTNVEKSIAVLRQNGHLDCCAISSISKDKLAMEIRSSGFYNQKSLRLHNLCSNVCADYGSLDAMRNGISLDEARNYFSAMNGIGRETLHSILLYALDLPVFVMDKYTERVLTRMGFMIDMKNVSAVEESFLSALDHDVDRLKNIHAMLDAVAKDYCQSRPKCRECVLNQNCDYWGREVMVP
ncbi:MAG: endonuclease III domain-containing protein [Thermoplasmataceae archaeon]